MIWSLAQRIWIKCSEKSLTDPEEEATVDLSRELAQPRYSLRKKTTFLNVSSQSYVFGTNNYFEERGDVTYSELWTIEHCTVVVLADGHYCYLYGVPLSITICSV